MLSIALIQARVNVAILVSHVFRMHVGVGVVSSCANSVQKLPGWPPDFEKVSGSNFPMLGLR